MFFHPTLFRHPEFRAGMRDLAPQALGIAAWGLVTGVAILKAGLTPFEAVFMTLLVFAGSAQLAATPLILVGAPLWVILGTALAINLRFVVFSLHLRQYLIHLPRWQRLIHGYFCGDISYVLFIRRYPVPGQSGEERLQAEAFLTGNYFLNWFTWMMSSLLGIVLANFIPPAWGLGFAGFLCILGILCSLLTSRLRILAAFVAAVASILAYNLPLRLNIVFAITATVSLCLMAEKIKPPLPKGHF